MHYVSETVSKTAEIITAEKQTFEKDFSCDLFCIIFLTTAKCKINFYIIKTNHLLFLNQQNNVIKSKKIQALFYENLRKNEKGINF